MRIPAGDLDRRITIETATTVQDNAGDPVKSWAAAFRLFARRTVQNVPAGAGNETLGDQSVIRRTEVTWEVRDGPLARSIAPESHRIRYQGRVYEVLSLFEGRGRADRIWIRCAATPDLTGTMAPEVGSGG